MNTEETKDERTETSIRVYLTNLGAYNSGKLIGQWLNLPMSEEDLEKAVKEVLGNNEEYFITDYEAPFTIGEYDNLTELNEFAEEFEDLRDEEKDAIAYLLEYGGYDDKQTALDNRDEVIIYYDTNLADVAEQLVDDGIFGEIPESIQNYIDYEKIANDLLHDGYTEIDGNVYEHKS